MKTCFLVVALVFGFIPAATCVVTFHVAEEADVGTFIGSIPSATNLTFNISGDEASSLWYKFSSVGYNTMYFTINPISGVLTTDSHIDRELICGSSATCQKSFDVIAQSQIGSFFKRISVVVDIIDVNDNSPYFRPSATTLDLKEDLRFRYVKLQTDAHDKDIGINSELSYQIIPPSSQFGIKSSQAMNGDPLLLLEIKEPLDRKRQDFYEFYVQAKDHGLPPLTGTLLVTLNVLDANDNAPRFTQDVYHASIPEDIPIGYSILEIWATDNDVGNNARLSFSIYPQTTQTVAIDAVTGEIKSKIVFDRERISSYMFRILAKDNGSPQLTGTATVILNITDVNDNSPQFNVKSYNFYVLKNASIGTVIGHVAAFDPDTGVNGKVSFSYFDLTNTTTIPFEITPNGIIRTLRELDRDKQNEYNFRVMAVDHGQPQFRSFAPVSIRVQVDEGQTVFG